MMKCNFASEKAKQRSTHTWVACPHTDTEVFVSHKKMQKMRVEKDTKLQAKNNYDLILS